MRGDNRSWGWRGGRSYTTGFADPRRGIAGWQGPLRRKELESVEVFNIVPYRGDARSESDPADGGEPRITEWHGGVFTYSYGDLNLEDKFSLPSALERGGPDLYISSVSWRDKAAQWHLLTEKEEEDEERFPQTFLVTDEDLADITCRLSLKRINAELPWRFPLAGFVWAKSQTEY